MVTMKLLQASFFLLLTLTLTLHALLSSSATAAAAIFLSRLVDKPVAAFSLLCFAAAAAMVIAATLRRRCRPVYLLGYSCFKPDTDRKCSYEACEYFVRRSGRFSHRSEEFMRGIYLKSGLGDETYVPPFIFQTSDQEARLASAIEEAEESIAATVDALLAKIDISAGEIEAVIVACGMFGLAPSLASFVVNRYKLREGVRAYNLSGMGCSSGASAVDLAARLLRRDGSRYALVVATENISLNWYFGEDRSMLVTNCIFRAGCAAALLTSDAARRGDAKLELVRSLRTHRGANDAAYSAAFQGEDDYGNMGVSLKKDLVRVAGEGLRAHVRELAPRVLPLSELVRYAYRAVTASWLWRRRGMKPVGPHVPDFGTAFEHMCIHTGGKAVIESVSRVMGLAEPATEPARMTLHRFGNTSSSLVFYELAYFEAKGRVRAGDRVWMIAFGTGFKVCSLVWKALKDSGMDPDNPWKDCVHRYPVKAW